jgi:hypothetical protein
MDREDKLMKKVALIILAVAVSAFFTVSAFAGSLAPGSTTSCNSAKSITLTNNGGSSGDRSNANMVVWKEMNATTVPITLGPGEHNGFPGNGGGSAGYKGKNGNDKVHMGTKHIMGRKSVTLFPQPNFSRGDSIGGISGEVRITNNGTIGVSVACN